MNSKTAVMGLLLAVLVSALAATAIMMAKQSGLSGATIYVSPPSISGNIGQTFEVDINVSGASDLYGWESKLGWNTSLLEVVNVTESTFLKTGADTYLVSKMSNTEGWTLAGCTRLRNTTGANGNGTLATVEFKAKKEGTCTLNLYDTKLVNSQRQLMSHNTVDGLVTIPDTAPPSIAVLSPQNKTYHSNQVPLTFEINESASWIGYSLDSQPNTTISGNTTITVEFGRHEIVVYANDTFGNMGVSDIVHFTVTLPWDVNGDGKCDMKDIGVVVRAFGSVPGHPKWNPNADINDDSLVDMKDIGIAVRHFGEAIF